MKKMTGFCLLILLVSVSAGASAQEAFFELPVANASGYAFVDLNVRARADTNAEITGKLKQSEGFRVVEEIGTFWKIAAANGTTGYVKHQYCYINLPDVLPSIVYRNSNASSSLLRVGELEIPSITGQKLYDAYTYNPRLGEDSFIMPIKYATAKRLSVAQNQARQAGNTLIIYETFRPYAVQRAVVNNLSELIKRNKQAHHEINSSVWGIGWFISTRLSNHQRGSAIDLSLGKVVSEKVRTSGDYKYTKITQATEYQMQTPIHQLSIQSVIFDNPARKTYSKKVTDGTLKLHQYMTSAGFTPLASEWWHFDDNKAFRSRSNRGNYVINRLFSQPPEKPGADLSATVD